MSWSWVSRYSNSYPGHPPGRKAPYSVSSIARFRNKRTESAPHDVSWQAANQRLSLASRTIAVSQPVTTSNFQPVRLLIPPITVLPVQYTFYRLSAINGRVNNNDNSSLQVAGCRLPRTNVLFRVPLCRSVPQTFNSTGTAHF
jgi:hypothetical protein